MANVFHKDFSGDDNHALPARTYADVAARDSDVAFQVAANIDKKVRVESPGSYYMLFSVGPAVWLETSNTASDDFLDMLDAPSSYSGQAGKVAQVNAGETALEFGQALRPTDNPTFNVLTVDGNCGLVVGSSPPFFDDAGFLTLENIDGLDPQTKFTFENVFDSFPNLTSIQGQSILLTGSLTVEAASILNQDLTSDASPTFAQVTLGNAGLIVGASIPFSDTAGTLTLQNVNAIDPTTEATLEAAIDSLPSLVFIQGQAISLSGCLSVMADSVIDQDLTIGADPTFRDLLLTGDLTVQGATTSAINTATLVVQDKNIDLGAVTIPTDLTADGGGITLKASTDLTILWLNATNAWTFNQSIDLLGNNLLSTGVVNVGQVVVDNLKLDGNTLSSTFGDLDVTTQAGGVYKFNDNAFRAGLDAANYLEVGHGGSNSFINSVGAGGMDFRFGGTTKATFTPFGHLHLLTDVDQKHTLKIVTANNLNETGIAWENSGGNFSQTIFRKDVGSNRSDLVFAIGSNANIDLLTDSFKIHGSAVSEGRLEILGSLQISSGGPGLNKVLTSDADGLANWALPAGGGWSDAGATIILTNINDSVGIGESGPDTKLHVADGGIAGAVTPTAGTIITCESPSDGYLSIITPDANEKGIIFGGPQSAKDGGIVFNAAETLRGLEFRVNGNVAKMHLTSAGKLGIGTAAPNAALDIRGTPGASVGGFPSGALHVTSESALVNANSVITGHNLFGGNKQLWYLGSSSSSNDDITFINRQIGDMSFSTSSVERMRILAAGNVGIGVVDPTEKLVVNGNVKATTIIDTSIFAQLNSSVDQVPTDTNPTVITYNTQDAITGLTHSTTVNPGEITIDTAGTYFVSPQPQVGKDSGGVKVDFDMFLQVDRGSGFVDEANSNIKLAIKDADITDVIVSAFTISLNVGDKIRMMQKVSSSTVGMGLKNTNPVVGPPSVPRTPSIIFTMYRIGG